VARVEAQLARLGVADVVVLPDGGPAAQVAAVAAGLSGRTLVVDGDLIVADACLGQLVDDPSVRSGVLVSEGLAAAPEDSPLGSAAPVRVAQRRVASAGSAVHSVSGATGVALGSLVVDDRDAAAAATALAAAAQVAEARGWQVDGLDLALVALVRAQVAMGAVGAVGPALRGGDARQREAVFAELAAVDEARVLLERANRPDDGFYSTFVLRRASKPLTSLALRLGLSSNQVSVFSLAVGLAAAGCFAVGSWWGLLAGALLLQASLIIDCVDGEVARFTRSFSDLGAWIDASSDRVKEYAAYAGLAAGAARSGQDVWARAALVMILQTLRHVGDYDFSRVQRIREGWVPTLPLDQASDGGTFGAGATLELSARMNTDDRVRWAKKVLRMPIGERWLVLSVGAVTVGPRGTLLVLLALGTVALVYTLAGRVLRSRTWHHPADRSGAWLLAPQLDHGPLWAPLWSRLSRGRDPLAGAFGWAWPMGLRLVELGLVWAVAVAVAPGSAAWLFAWVFVVVFHHYDTLYRALGGSAPPRWLVWAGLGWDGRTVVVLVAAALGAAALAGLLAWGSLALGMLFVVVASWQWIRSLRVKDGARA
jgi:phosphatidylglycerophosphate synthase